VSSEEFKIYTAGMKLFFGSFYSYEVQLFHAFSMTIFPFAFSSEAPKSHKYQCHAIIFIKENQ